MAGLTAVLVCFVFNRSFENDAMVVTWEEGGGEPAVVEGTVMRKGNPIAGQYRDIVTGSGGNGVTTDSSGKFSKNVHEYELVAFEVEGKGRIDWYLLFGPSISNGVRFQVDLK